MLMSRLFFIRYRRWLNDTQTGLRRIPRALIEPLLTCPENRYDFEWVMLVTAIKRRIPLLEIPIRTVYCNNNRHSHFRPWRDSLRVLRTYIAS